MRKPYYIKAVLSMPPLQFPKKITTVAAVWVCIEIWIWIWIWNWITGTSGHSFQEQRTPRRNKKPNPRHRSTASRDSEKIVLQACFWRVSKTRCKKKKKLKKKHNSEEGSRTWAIKRGSDCGLKNTSKFKGINLHMSESGTSSWNPSSICCNID